MQPALMFWNQENKTIDAMSEQVILFNTVRSLPRTKYQTCKPVFCINGLEDSECSMLVHDRENVQHWKFVVQYKNIPGSMQEKDVCVLYLGKSFRAPSGTVCINIVDFMLAVDKYRDMDKVFHKITKEK